jgi:hypothetical protein
MQLNIDFVCSDRQVLEHFPIIPAKECIPSWYAKLNAKEQNISKCFPVRDVITAGYIIPNAYEQLVGIEFDGEIDQVGRITPVERIGEFFEAQDHMSHPNNGHTHNQCPVVIEGKKKGYFKVQLPWTIKTPKGYSCLFMQPFYQFQEDITVMPGIIDTDEFDLSQLNFPCYMNKAEAELKPGRPLVQIIPFKRDEWRHKLSFKEKTTGSKMNFFLNNMYKRAFHKKKKFI